MRLFRAILLPSVFVTLMAVNVNAEPLQSIHEHDKCPVCGMFVAMHDRWLAQIIADDYKPLIFDGVKDMMSYYFNPGQYGGTIDTSKAEIWVRNYYTLKYIDGRSALYVIGSDVLGPMGDELIPFSTGDEAEQFKKDHHGTAILRFDEITAEQIMTMKKKHMLKMKKKGKKTM